MPVILRTKTYKWLRLIQVFRNEALPSVIPQHCEVPYDEEIYLENGYLIGVTLRKFVVPYSQFYTDLLGVRKIAILKSSQNWQIIEPYLTKLGCQTLKRCKQEDIEIQITSTQIAQMLEALYDEFSPKEKQQRLALTKKLRCNYIDFYNFNADKNLDDTENSLQLFCIVLVRVFGITISEALGLLINRFKYFKKLVVEGSNKDQFQSIKKLYEQITIVWPTFEELTVTNPSDMWKLLEGLSEGALSENINVIHATLNLLSYVKQEDWFLNYGYYKLLSSSYIQCFYFTIQRLSPHYQFVLNQKLHMNISDKAQLLTILLNLIKILPKTIYCKQILQHIPIEYFYQQCYTILNQQMVDEQPHNLVILAKELAMALMINFTGKIPVNYAAKVIETFKFHSNRSYWDIYHTLALLFDVLETLMNKQSFLTEKFFKIVMRYLGSTPSETKHWIIQNLKYLFDKIGKLFPLNYLLEMYAVDNVAQADQYQLFDLIANDNIQLSKQEVTDALTYLTHYVQNQIHCHCFMNIINKFLLNHSKMAANWGQQFCMSLLQKMDNIKIPLLNEQNYVLNPMPPSKNRVINAIGLKRKQMLKFKEFEQCKELLEVLLKIKDKAFLHFYSNSLQHTISTIEKQIGHKKMQLINLYKKLRKSCKKAIDQIPQSESMSELVKNIMLSKSIVNKTQRSNLNEINIIENKLNGESQSVVIGENQQKILAIREIEDENNEFLGGQYETNNVPGMTDSHLSIKNPPPENSQVEPPQQSLSPILLPFTQQPQQQNHTLYYEHRILEQNEIIYINMMKHKYNNLISYCTGIYSKLDARLADNREIVEEFLKEIGLSNVIEGKVGEELMDKCQALNNSNSREVVENFLVQIAYHAFGFKKNMRITVLCVSSLLTLLEDNLKQVIPHTKIPQTKRKQQKLQAVITTDIKFEYMLSDRIIGKGQRPPVEQSSLVCFYTLSEIFNRGFGINLIEPLSRMVNNIPGGTPSSLQSHKQSVKSLSVQESKNLDEMEVLQQELQSQKSKQLQNSKIKSNNERNRFKKQKKKAAGASQISFEDPPKTPGSKIVDNAQLKNRLAVRIKILGQEMNQIAKQNIKKQLANEKQKQQI